MRSERSKKWQLTENNASYDKVELAETLAKLGETLYCVACSEKGESGTKHLHAFVVYKNAISIESIKKMFPRSHLEHVRGTNEENRAYITKDGDFYEIGVCPLAVEIKSKQDIAKDVFDCLKAGKSPFEIMDEHPDLIDYVVQHYRSLVEIYERDVRTRRSRR